MWKIDSSYIVLAILVFIIALILIVLWGCQAQQGSWFRRTITPKGEIFEQSSVAWISGWVIPCLIAGAVFSAGSFFNGSKSAAGWFIACGIGIAVTILSQAAQAAINERPMTVTIIVITAVVIPALWFIYSGFLKDKGFMIWRKPEISLRRTK